MPQFTESLAFMKQTFTPISVTDTAVVLDWILHPSGFVGGHYHKDSDELFEIVSGEGIFKVDGKPQVCKAGARLLIPKLVPHSITNKTDKDLVCRVTYSPPGDQGILFLIVQHLRDKDPNIQGVPGKMFYISRKLGYKDLSVVDSAVGRGIFNFMMAMLMAYGNVRGWGVLAADFAKANARKEQLAVSDIS